MKWIVMCGAVVAAQGGLAETGWADTCWNHNGSITRLLSEDDTRTLVYEKVRSGLWAADVDRGTWLFTGKKMGDDYRGTARVFVAGCAPLEYPASGAVLQDPLRIEVRGEHPVQQDCEPTGETVVDRLVFTYMYDC